MDLEKSYLLENGLISVKNIYTRPSIDGVHPILRLQGWQFEIKNNRKGKET